MDDDEFSREDFIEMIGEFMSGSMTVHSLYRSHLISTLVSRVYDEFGSEGMAELMIKIDDQAEWITDILIDSNDLQDLAFKKYGVYDDDISSKARHTDAMHQMNKKITNLRKRYAKLIVDEIFSPPAVESPAAQDADA